MAQTSNTMALQPNQVVMVRPHFFQPNPETAKDNFFQKQQAYNEAVAKKAYQEVTNAVETLQQYGIKVHLFEDNTQLTPDSVFPNNWFTVHQGVLTTYPMYCQNRRAERRVDIIEYLQNTFSLELNTALVEQEHQGKYLEGTGAMVIDHQAKLVYAARSHRMDESLLHQFCDTFGFNTVMFDATDANNQPIYHTNVMMCIGQSISLIGLSTIKNESQRNNVVKQLSNSGKTIVEISQQQISLFAGNAIELQGNNQDKTMLVISRTAKQSLTKAQIAQIEQHCELVDIDVSTIELAGGSIRCMIAVLHL